jgi:hypothetical protein
MEPAAAFENTPRPRIEYIPGRVTCPLASLGTRAANASNRLVIDDPATEVMICDGTITIRDDIERSTKTVIADLVWLAEGLDAAGARVPFTIHLEITKTGHTYAIDLHTHEPHEMRRTSFVYEPLEIVALDGGRRTLLVDHDRLTDVVARVPLSRRLMSALTLTRDHLAGVVQDPTQPGYRLVDQSIGIGAFGHGAVLVRSRLVSLAGSNAALIAQGSITDMLRDGAWELCIEARTDRTLPEIVGRELVLLGLDRVPLLHDACAGKLRRGQVLTFRCVPGGGEIGLDGERAPLPDAVDVARTYLEFHMLGGMLAAAIGK